MASHWAVKADEVIYSVYRDTGLEGAELKSGWVITTLHLRV